MASSQYSNPLSAISYSNKDFRAIFQELLDLTKKLTYKWDPSISNESDPGVILLKLNAVIGDKNNYNIDKNILEAFPETVTQDFSARSLYKQLSYKMPWYNSATTTISFKWKGETLEPGESVAIPAFTMITNSDNSIIYTLVEDVMFTYGKDVSSGRAIQGVITDLLVSGSSIFKLDNIDYNNRIYLNDYNVAENGLFITNAEESSMGFWQKVDNLSIEPQGNRYFEFGVDSRSNNTYIEFPNDIESLIKAGLKIKYLISDGIKGNVAAKELTKFYEDNTIEFRGEKLNLNDDIIQMYNASATTDGSDPESVTDAYNSYKKVAGTFDTLVTLRDYTNAIYRSGMVSNDVVADRLHDSQCSYTIVTDGYGSGDKIVEYSRFKNESTNDLSPYDLKLYVLHNAGVVNSISNFNSTFDLESSQSTTCKQIENYLQSVKCMQHNFSDILPDRPCMFRNIYPIKIRFVPQYQLSNIQINDVKKNIISAIFENLNSRKLNFGEKPDFNLIYDVVVNADERIKIITIDDFNYTTYATYWESDGSGGGRFKSIPISDFSTDPWIITRDKASMFPEAIKSIKDPSSYTYIATENNSVYKFNSNTQQFIEYSTLINDFRIDVITRSILAGVTPLYKQDTSFTYSIDQVFDHTDTDVDRVTTDLVISPWGFNDNGTPKNWDPDTKDTIKEYKLKDNESVQFLAPSFITEISYSNYVRFELVLKDKTSDESIYELSNAYNYSITKGTYEGVSNISLYIALETGGYEKYVDFGDKTNNEDYEYVAGSHPGSLAWFNNKVLTFEGYNGTVKLTSYLAWQRDYLTLYTETPAYIVYANTDYKLKEGDSITFFWKETDEDDAPYQYRCFKGIAPEKETDSNKSPIIRPTFTINGTGPESTIKIDPNKLTSTGNIPYNANPYSDYQKVYSMYGDNTLSGTKTIDIRRMNQVNLVKDYNYYYFITNTTEETIVDGEVSLNYVLKFEPRPKFVPNVYYIFNENTSRYNVVTKEPATWGYGSTTYYTKSGNVYNEVKFTYDYTLKTDEYFIYTNNDMSAYELLGSGTLIRLSENMYIDSLPVLRVVAVDYADVAMMGLEAFTDKTKKLSVNGLVREQQIYNLTGGDSISITINDDFIGMPYAQTVGNKLVTGISFPYFSTNTENSVNGITVQYSTGGAGFTALPSIEIEDNNANWSGSAILNINATYDSAQIIDNTMPGNGVKQSLQQLILRNTENNDASIQYPVDPLRDNTRINVLSNVSLNKTGGNNIDVTYLDAYGERKSVSLFAFLINSLFNQPPFSKTAEYGIRMNFILSNISSSLNISTDSSGISSIKVPGIKLETGFKYILGIRNTSMSRKFWLLDSSEETPTYLSCLNTNINTDNQNIAGKGLANGKYYFLIDNTNEPSISSITVQIDGEDEVGYLEFDNLLKCVENKEFDKYGIPISVIEKKVPEYDYNGHFKYNYQVPSDVIIEDPLEAVKFFEENHVYNGYTISHVNLNIPSEASMNTAASSIEVMNNR